MKTVALVLLAWATILLINLVTYFSNVKNKPSNEGERVVANVLKRIAYSINGYVVNDIIICDKNGLSHQIDHVIICPLGIYCIETKAYSGFIHGNKKDMYWFQRMSTGSSYEFYNPVLQNDTHIRALHEVLGYDVQINSLIVFTKSLPDVDTNEVIHINRLKEFFYNLSSLENLSDNQVKAFYQKLLDAKSDVSLKEHVRRISTFKN